jgi:hypothetical protein
MMDNIQMDALGKKSCLPVGLFYPEPIVEANAPFLTPARVPIVKPAVGSNPNKVEAFVWLMSEKFIYPILVFGVGDDPDFIGAGQVPRPIPCEPRFRA